jgi:hypothetical protein
MRLVAMLIGLMAVSACNRKTVDVQVAKGKESSGGLRVPNGTQGKLEHSDGHTALEHRCDAGDSFAEEVESLLLKTGRRFARSPGDDRLTSFATEQLKQDRKTLPRNHRFIISKRRGHWVVSVLDFEAFREGEAFLTGKEPGIIATYHISDEGRLRVLYSEAGI